MGAEVSARLIYHGPTIIVELEANDWLKIEAVAREQAAKNNDWTVVNLLMSAFELAKQTKEERIGG